MRKVRCVSSRLAVSLRSTSCINWSDGRHADTQNAAGASGAFIKDAETQNAVGASGAFKK